MKKVKKLILLDFFCMISIGASAADIPNNEIWYTSSNGKVVTPYKSDVFGASIVSNTYSNGKGIIKFNGNVTEIGNAAFSGCSGLTSVTIPNSVTSIGSYAFDRCSGLTSVTIPNSVTSIGSYAFYYCKGLASVTIPNSVTSIGSYAFSSCSGLTSVTIPNSVTSIGSSAFSGCSGLSSVTIPNSVTSIGSYAFYGCSGLTSVTIPNSVTSIGSYAFSGCSGLTSVTIPNSVTYIGASAFRSCSGLTSVTIPNSVTSIREYAFSDCKGLTSVTIPNSVTSIGEWAFNDCSGLTSVAIGNSVTSIGDWAFSGCSSLTSVAIGNSVTSIGDWAFSGCSGLTSVTIPNSVTSIGDYAFDGCTSLPVIDNVRYADTYLIKAVDKNLSTYKIKEGTKWIGSYAFEYCDDLTSVNMKATTPPTCQSSVFYEVDISNTTLIVPIGCILAYKKADVWRDFGTITDGEVEFPKIKVTKKEATQTTITLILDYDKEKCIPFEEIGVKCNGRYFKANSEGTVKVDYCEPGKEITVYSYAKYGGEYYISNLGINVSTKPLNPEIAVSDVMANKTFVRGVYDIGDAHIYKTTFNVYSKYDNYEIKEQEYKNDKFALTGLAPNTEYMITYYVYYHYGEGDKKSSYTSITKNLTTAQLKMKTLNPKNVSSTSSVVAAEANISDDETGAGFEWRKYDAPESLPSSRGKAIVFDGKMEGKINNLQPVYYNVRPYYESASGKVFYGGWITFDPTDFSYFEPTVHTYDFIDNPTTNSVEVRGYVMQGTDAVTEQGFEYWKTGKASKSKAAGNDVIRIKASGQMMIATLKDLDFESNYIVRAYVTTASGTIYGEERSFTTPKATPEETLGDANLDGSINVNDITTIAKFILEGKVSPWSEVNADANEDGTINVNDITKTAEIILLRAKAEMEAAQRKK